MYMNDFMAGIDKHEIGMTLWENVDEPKAVLQVFHGMAEHIKRYDAFARYLNFLGLIVVGHDHRGHGDSKRVNLPYGYLGESGFDKVVEEGHMVTSYIKKKYPGLPIVLFAHSFGSFVAQKYICRYGQDIQALILSGSAMKKGIDIHLAYGIAKAQVMVYDDHKPGKLLDKLSFGAFNKRINNPKTAFDWLSSDPGSVDKYIKDPRCGQVSPLNFYSEFLGGLKGLYKTQALEAVPKNLPLLIVSGQDDPVGGYGKSLHKLRAMYNDLGLVDVTLNLYDGGRHELLNEVKAQEVFEDLGRWILSKI